VGYLSKLFEVLLLIASVCLKWTNYRYKYTN